MKGKDKILNDATSDQGNGVPNIVEQNASIPSSTEQASLKVPSSRGNVGEIKEIDATKEKTKTSAAAEVVMGSSNSTGSAGSLMRGVSFGGGAGNIIGKDVSATTKADNVYKSGSRLGKRDDPITRKIDFNYPEEVSIKVKQSKPLSETTEKQGYNGNYMDEHAITQKVSGGAPADPLFNRSVDLIGVDMAYYADGQYNRSKGVDYKEYAADSWNGSSYASTVSTTRGSYMLKDLTLTVNENGAIGMSWSEDDLSNKDLDEATARLAGDAALRTLNQRELDRLNMVDKAGNESDPSWCPLGDAMPTASAVNHILADIDAIAGDNIFMSERKLAEALAYQVNKSGKDGIRVKGPMAEMMNGNIEGQYSSAISSISETNGQTYALRSSAVFAAGGAGLWLALNDSLSKYTTKGKLLTMPLSFKNALNIAKANDGEFRLHDGLLKDVEHCELYSTINAPYDPFLPIVVTDKANVINSMSFYDTATVSISSSTTVAENVFPDIFTYHYENLRNRYDIPVFNFFAKGLFNYFKSIAHKLWSIENAPSAVDGIKTYVIPIQSSMTSISLWDLFVCSAVPFMVPERQKALVDVIKYQENFGYPYTGLVAIKDIDVNTALNYNFISTEAGLVSKIADPIDAIKIQFPEVFWTVGCKAFDDHTLGNNHGFMYTDTVLPHYFNQSQFMEKSLTDGALVNSDNPSVISYPSTRSGVCLSDMDVVYGMTEEDYRLALDRMVVYPGYTRVKTITDIAKSKANGGGSDLFKYNYADSTWTIEPAKTYKYGITGDGIPVLPYLASSESSDEKARCLTILDIMKTPRELGLHFVVPAGILTPVRDASTGYANFRDTSSGYLAVSGPGFTAYLYKVDGTAMKSSILDNANYSISRSSTYLADYVVIQAIPSNAATDFGMVFSISKGLKATNVDHTYTLDGGSFDFVPFVTGSYTEPSYNDSVGVYSAAETQATSTNHHLDVISFQKYFWNRLQRLPFVINPFDANCSDLSYNDSTYNAGNKYDIYDLLYFFGFCGFRASDYQELTYERNRARIAYGMNYVNDPYIDKTLLLK